jgi:LysR family glycine cleavage system transcriptional activator
MLGRVSIKAIQIFEAAARLSSFTRAAEELCVTPSAVSHQIKMLENQYGVPLFHRIHRGVVLTDAGQRYSEEVSAAFERIEQATRELGLTQKSDILTINSSPSFAIQWLMPRIARFSALYPQIDVRLNTTSYPVSDRILESVDLDIRFGAKRIWPPSIMAIDLPAETIVPLCSPVLADGGHPIRSAEDLQYHVLIHSELCAAGWREWLQLHPDVKLDLVPGTPLQSFFYGDQLCRGWKRCMP